MKIKDVIATCLSSSKIDERALIHRRMTLSLR